MEENGRVLVDKMVLICAVNQVIRDAIDHGGDSGGPYYTYPDELRKSVENLAGVIGCGWEWDKDWEAIENARKRGDESAVKFFEGIEGDGIRLVPEKREG